MTFPTLKGSNLLREKLVLPRDFQGELNLLFIPFEQWHQMEVDSWMELVKELENQYSGLAYYELPTLQTRNVLYRTLLNEGMRAGIPNPKTRERTITLYLDKAKFQQLLNMPDEAHIYILVVDRQGKEFFRAVVPIPLRERPRCVRHSCKSLKLLRHELRTTPIDMKWIEGFVCCSFDHSGVYAGPMACQLALD